MQNSSLLKNKGWTPKQLKMMELLADPMDSRTKEEKACELGISVRALYKWQKLPGWHDDVREVSLAGLGGRLPNILRALGQKAEAGDVASIKLVSEILGLIKSGKDVIVNNALGVSSSMHLTQETAERLLTLLQKKSQGQGLPDSAFQIIPPHGS